MPPAGALVFKLEQTFFRADLDYGEVLGLIGRAQPSPLEKQSTRGLATAMLELKKRLGKEEYQQERAKAEAAAEKAETRALEAAQMHPGVVKMLEAVRDTGWWVVAASDMGKKPIAAFLKSRSLRQYMNMVVARSRLDEERTLAKSLRPVQAKLTTLANSVYFCNSSREVVEAKTLGMRCFVLPSHVEPFRALYQAGPNGILLSLDEIPTLLSLPNMKPPAQAKATVEKKPRRGMKKVASGITPKTH